MIAASSASEMVSAFESRHSDAPPTQAATLPAPESFAPENLASILAAGAV